jgi:2,5-furandicarboxylate decarboxylase 1
MTGVAIALTLASRERAAKERRPVHDFRGLVGILEARGEIDHVRRAVEPRFEMPALMQQVDRAHRAFLFENVRGARLPLVGGLLNRLECYGWALGSPPGERFTAEDLAARIDAARSRPLAPREVATGPVKEKVSTGDAIDLGELPVPTAFEHDTGAFITGACGITRNPRTGRLNAGIYRTLVLGRQAVAIYATTNSDLWGFYEQAERSGESMPIALAIGVEPALLIAAVCKLPTDESEIELAGALHGRPIELVKCETSDLRVPANAEIVIEGRVDFSRRIENTLGEFAGLYGPGTAPATEVTALTRRRDAKFYSILAGRNPEHNTLGSIAAFSIRKWIAEALRSQFPRVRDVHVYLEAKLGSMAHIVLAIDKRDDAEPMALIEAAFGATFATPAGRMPLSLLAKRIIVVDGDVDVHDLEDVEWAMWSRVAAAPRFRVVPDVASWELERCARPGLGSLRLAIDATMDLKERDKLCRPVIPGAGAIRLADYLEPRPVSG